jgi:hypothetical protein
MEAKCAWERRFPLTERRVWADMRSVPHGRLVHIARAAERWGAHPTIARVLIYNVSPGGIDMFETGDPDELNGGMLPADVSRWWAQAALRVLGRASPGTGTTRSKPAWGPKGPPNGSWRQRSVEMRNDGVRGPRSRA